MDLLLLRALHWEAFSIPQNWLGHVDAVARTLSVGLLQPVLLPLGDELRLGVLSLGLRELLDFLVGELHGRLLGLLFGFFRH